MNYLTDVGAFTNCASFYGTFDQTGNVTEWNDLDGTAGSFVGLRGGSWRQPVFNQSSSYSESANVVGFFDASFAGFSLGFRLASPAAVPEIDPAIGSSAISLVAGVLAMIEQRRRRAALSASA